MTRPSLTTTPSDYLIVNSVKLKPLLRIRTNSRVDDRVSIFSRAARNREIAIRRFSSSIFHPPPHHHHPYLPRGSSSRGNSKPNRVIRVDSSICSIIAFESSAARGLLLADFLAFRNVVAKWSEAQSERSKIDATRIARSCGRKSEKRIPRHQECPKQTFQRHSESYVSGERPDLT